MFTRELNTKTYLHVKENKNLTKTARPSCVDIKCK